MARDVSESHSHIADYEEMVEWLEGSGWELDEEIWGFKEVVYQYSDLKNWLDKNQKQKTKQVKKMIEEKISKKQKVEDKVGKGKK